MRCGLQLRRKERLSHYACRGTLALTKTSHGSSPLPSQQHRTDIELLGALGLAACQAEPGERIPPGKGVCRDEVHDDPGQVGRSPVRQPKPVAATDTRNEVRLDLGLPLSVFRGRPPTRYLTYPTRTSAGSTTCGAGRCLPAECGLMFRTFSWLFLLASIGLLVWALTLDGPDVPSAKPDATSSAAPPATEPSASQAASVPVADVRRARRDLAALAVIDRHPTDLPSYSRDDFGDSWADTDGNSCNQRDDVLFRDAKKGTAKVARQDSCDHDVLAGTWLDPYTGKSLTFTDLKDAAQSQAIQIDHVVPLSEAFQSGASAWTSERRRGFANDLGNLLAVDGPTNASKGDDDPAAWRPRKAFQCSYAVRWISVKHRWNLGADASEVAALVDMLGYCR